MAGLSQAEIDAVQASRRKKEAAGGGHPSFQGKNKGQFQQGGLYLTDPDNWKYRGTAGDLVKGILDPAGAVFDRHMQLKVTTDPKAAENRYNQNMIDAMQRVEDVRGLSSEDVRGRSQLDAISQMAKSGIRSGGPLGVASGLGAASRAQTATTRASAAGVLNDVAKMTDILGGLYGDEEQMKWMRALAEGERKGVISKINHGLLKEARVRNADKWSRAGVQGAGIYADWSRGQDQKAASEALQREKDLDNIDRMHGIGDQSSAEAFPPGPGEMDL